MAKSKKPTGPQKPSRLRRQSPGEEVAAPGARVSRLAHLSTCRNSRMRRISRLKEELATFKGHLEELLRDEGKYVLIKGREVIGIYDDQQEALREAAIRFGGEPVLIKEIAVKERIHTMGGVVY